MKELSIEEKARRYDEALKQIKECTPDDNGFITIYPQEIFPELTESEDERIRKSIIAIINNYVDNSNTFKPKMIAWLEAQGEHKKFRDSIQVGDKVTRNEAGVLVNLSQLNRVAKKEEKKGEQKPVDLVTILDDYFANTPKEQQDKDWEELKHLNNFGWELSEQKHAWSEEDIKMIDMIEKSIHGERYNYYKKPIEEMSSWLKSLKGKVQLQNMWKPTKAMMDALKWAKDEYHSDDHVTMNNLKYLYEELKKL